MIVNTSLTTSYSLNVTAVTTSDSSSNYGLLEGAVTEINGTTPIKNASVRLVSSDGETTTKQTTTEGFFSFSDVPAGNASILIKKTGYQDETRAVEIPANDTLWISVSMKKNSGS